MKNHVISVLFYCDDADESWVSPTILQNLNPSPGEYRGHLAHRFREHEFGLGIAKWLLERQTRDPFIRYEVTVVNRHYEYDNNGRVSKLLDETSLNLITPELLSSFSQIWIFGMHYGNGVVPEASHAVTIARVGNPNWRERHQQEFSAAELQVLEAWTDAGNGILITGDHTNGSYNLGRALGRSIKRARELRHWDDGPMGVGPTHVDTCRNEFGNADTADEMTGMPLQQDEVPQNLIFQYGLAYPGAPSITPHDLFLTTPTAENPTGVIRVLPDHTHEGAVKLPQSFTHADAQGRLVWPMVNNVQPQPAVVAWGTNYANPQKLNRRVPLIVAYDGHAVRVGNIVAQSTWHHFVNVNLVGFLDGAKATPTLRRIGEYYANLANYLDNPFATRIRFIENIALHVNFRSPISDGPDFGGEPSLTKNPIRSREAFAKEIGQYSARKLSRVLSPHLLRYRLLDNLRTEFVQHGIDISLIDKFDIDIILGETLAIHAEKFGDNLDQMEDSFDIFQEGMHRALKYYVQRQEKLLQPLQRLID